MPNPPTGRIVVIDDNADAADLFSMLLTAYRYDVRTAYGGKDGLGLVAAFRPAIVFSDIGMPGMSGYQVAQAIRAAALGFRPHMVATTGWGDADTVALASASGFDAHLKKPVDLDKVRAILSERAECGAFA